MSLSEASPRRTLIGTSGYSYSAWKGRFYPRGLSSRKMLEFYADQFSVVEINNSFYEAPQRQTVQSWRSQVPAHFQFTLKLPQTITHHKRLKAVARPWRDFLRSVSHLEQQLGPLLCQLPPNMKKERARLERFLRLVPETLRIAFEFRHPSWFDEDIYQLLRSRNAALCIADTDDLSTPMVVTSDWGYLRLRRVRYRRGELAKWAEQIAAQPWGQVYVFFKHEDEATGPLLAKKLGAYFATAR